MTSPPGDDNVRLSIWLVSFHADPADGPARPAPVERLQRAFGISAALAQQFLEGMPLVVKRHASKEEARGYVQTLIRIGAEVRVEPEEPAPVVSAPAAPAVEAPAPSTRLGRIALAQAVAPATPGADSMFEPEPPTMDISASNLGDSALPLGLLGEELPAEGFGVEEDWDALMPDPEAAPLPPVPWPDDLEVMLSKGVEAPPKERAPHEHNMLSLDAASLSDPGLLGTEEYHAVMQLNRDLAPSQEEDAPIALLDDLPSHPFGPPLGGAPSARPAQRVSQRQGPLPTEARLPSLEDELSAELAEDALPSLSELAPASGDIGRRDVLPSFDEAEAGAGLPSAPLMGVAPSPVYTPPKRGSAPTPSPPRHVTSPPRHTTAPPRQATAPPRHVTQPAAPAVEVEVGDGRGFWASLGVSLVAPVRGLGILWMPLIALVQVFAGCFLILPCFITQIIAGLTSTFLYMGLLGTYFGASVRKGMERDASAPELPELSVDVLKHEVIFRGAVLALLALVLFAIPTAVGYDAVRSVQPPDAPPSRTFDPQEPFFDDKGAQVEVKFGESARVLTDRQGNQVLVNPSGNEVNVLTPGAQREPVKVSKAKLTLFFVLLFVPLFYWPMALTVAALGGGVADIFNPVTVGKGIIRGGARYAAVAGIGALIFAAGMTGMVLTSLADAAAGTGGLTAALCGMLTPLFLYAYIHGVQGQLVGRLIAEQPDDFSDLLS